MSGATGRDEGLRTGSGVQEGGKEGWLVSKEEGSTQPMGVSGYQLPVTSRYLALNPSLNVWRGGSGTAHGGGGWRESRRGGGCRRNRQNANVEFTELILFVSQKPD